MTSSPSRLPIFGSIVRVELLDPQGRNPKYRPAVVVSSNEEITPGGEVWVVGITGTEGREPALEVPLQHDPKGVCRTGLRKPSVAACWWLVKVPVISIEWDGRRHVPPLDLADIAERVDAVRRRAAELPSDPDEN